MGISKKGSANRRTHFSRPTPKASRGSPVSPSMAENPVEDILKVMPFESQDLNVDLNDSTANFRIVKANYLKKSADFRGSPLND